MKNVFRIDTLPEVYKENLYLALGNFDGVHLGHQRVIETVIRKARENSGFSGALVFDPHPAKVISPKKELPLITDLQAKTGLMEKLGLDCIIVEPFTPEMARMHPDDFIKKYLKEIIKVKGIVAGYDYSFGYRARGDTEYLVEWGRKENIDVSVCPPVEVDREPVSSSHIREKVKKGEVEKAAGMLNYYFFQKGKVVSGKGRGRQLGYPTANIEISPELLLPAKGVYYTLVKKGDQSFPGATNVGQCPTFSSGNLTVEVHLLDFQDNLYGEYLTLYFIKKIRDEKTFSSFEELKMQLNRDVEQVKMMHRQVLNDAYLRVI